MIPSDDSLDAKEESASESGKPNHNTREDHPTTNTDKFFKKTFKEHPQRFSAFFAGCAVFISIVALFFSYKQMGNSGISAEAAKQSALNSAKSIAIADTAARISNRAYVHAVKVDIDTTNKISEIKVHITNNGKTPAYKTRQMAKIEVDTMQCLETLMYDKLKSPGSVGIIAQNITHFIKIKIDSVQHNATLKRVIRGKDKRILKVYGYVTYETIFAEKCSTSYSYVFYPGIGFSICPQNNQDYYIK